MVADKLGLADLCDYIQDQLLDSKKDLLKQNFVLLNRMSNDFEKLSTFCVEILKQDPKVIFRSKDFTSFTSEELLSYYKDYYCYCKSDNIPSSNNKIDQIEQQQIEQTEQTEQIEQIELWERLIQWGVYQLPDLKSDISEWTAEDFLALRRLINPMIEYIEFKKVSAEDFSRKIRPFRFVFDVDYYIQILDHFAFPNVKPPVSSQHRTSPSPPSPLLSPKRIISSLPSNITLNQSSTGDAFPSFPSHVSNISSIAEESSIPTLEKNSTLVTPIYFGLFTKWINMAHSQSTSYKFNLLLRGSYHGLAARIFHNFCDEKGPTITIVKVKDTNEIIGGYNPLFWVKAFPPGIHSKTKNSFIFSLDQSDLNKSIFSKVVDEEYAIHQHKDFGPCFGYRRSDLRLYGMGQNDKKLCGSTKISYEKRIRTSKLDFSIEDYEVWQVTKG